MWLPSRKWKPRCNERYFFQKMHRLLRSAMRKEIVILARNLNIEVARPSSDGAHLGSSNGLDSCSSKRERWFLAVSRPLFLASKPPETRSVRVNDEPKSTTSQILSESEAAYKIASRARALLRSRLSVSMYQAVHVLWWAPKTRLRVGQNVISLVNWLACQFSKYEPPANINER